MWSLNPPLDMWIVITLTKDGWSTPSHSKVGGISLDLSVTGLGLERLSPSFRNSDFEYSFAF